MPIRLCQKCGLKVLIDESQAGTNPFYCQRCTTAMKGQENAGPGPAKNPTPSPVAMASRSDPAAPSVGAGKSSTVRVLCPYCKASFNGRVPQKPARGSCPVCQKELILLPNGDIKPAAGFDLGQWQGDSGGTRPPESSPASEPPAPEMPKESGTRLLVKKYAAEPPPPAARPAARKAESPAPVTVPADTDVAEDTNPLPGWLDDSGSSSSPPVKPQPDTDMDIDVVPQQIDDVVEEKPLDIEEPAPPPAANPRARSPVVSKVPSLVSGRPPAAVEPAPELAPEPEIEVRAAEPTPRKALGRVPSGERKVLSAAPVAVGQAEETGGGKVFLALLLALLPVAACAGLLSSREKLNNDLVKKVGARFTVGFGKLHLKLFPPPPVPKPKIEEKAPPPEPPKEEPPKPDPDQQKKDEQKISHLFNENLMKNRKLKELRKTESADQAAGIKRIQDDISSTEDQIRRLRDMYQKMYGKDYDPANP